MIYGTADNAERTFKAATGFNKAGVSRPAATSAFNKPGTARPVATVVAPVPFNDARDSFRTTPVNPSKIFSNLISQAKAIIPQGKVGPRGTTMDDVARVAETGFAPITPTRTPPAQPPAGVSTADVLSSMIGAPSPTFGQKYGGMPSAAYFNDLVRGEAMNILAAKQMQQEEADRLAAPIEAEYATNVDPTKVGGFAGQKLREAQKLMRTGTPTKINGTTVNAGSLEALARQMAGGNFPLPVSYYGANMARINAARGTGDYLMPDATAPGGFRPATGAEQMRENAVQSAMPQAEALRQRDLQMSGAAQAQAMADAMGGMTASQIMQQIAIDRYGVDPGLAAGLFPISENASYQDMMDEAAKAQTYQETGFNPDWTVAETILFTQGPDALQQYQLQQAEYAMNGSPTQQLSAQKNEQDAENALFDEEARQTYGVDPGRVSGIDPEFMRDLLSDQGFINSFVAGRNDIVNGKDPLEVAAEYGSRYAKETGDMLGARAMGAILASFDLQSFQ